MLATTTPSIEGRKIMKYCGVVAGEAILGANLFKDVFAGIRDLVAGARRPMNGSCRRRGTSPCKRCGTRPPSSAAMRSSGSTSITRCSARATAC